MSFLFVCLCECVGVVNRGAMEQIGECEGLLLQGFEDGLFKTESKVALKWTSALKGKNAEYVQHRSRASVDRSLCSLVRNHYTH